MFIAAIKMIMGTNLFPRCSTALNVTINHSIKLLTNVLYKQLKHFIVLLNENIEMWLGNSLLLIKKERLQKEQ